MLLLKELRLREQILRQAVGCIPGSAPGDAKEKFVQVPLGSLRKKRK